MDPDYQRSVAGKTNVSHKITKRIAHFNTFKYPSLSPEGKEYAHLAQHPLQLNAYERNYELPLSIKKKERYQPKKTQEIRE